MKKNCLQNKLIYSLMMLSVRIWNNNEWWKVFAGGFFIILFFYFLQLWSSLFDHFLSPITAGVKTVLFLLLQPSIIWTELKPDLIQLWLAHYVMFVYS